MFIWRTDVIIEAIRQHIKELDEELSPLLDIYGTPEYPAMLDEVYRRIRAISIDYAVMEKAENVFVVEGDFGWNDVGSWDEVAALRTKDEQGNAIEGTVFTSGVTNSLIVSDKNFVAAIDIENLIVISTGDAVLVCKRGSSQDVKKVADFLKRKHLTDLL
jgi:mannose-1-phosphate guanylyltransferase